MLKELQKSAMVTLYSLKYEHQVTVCVPLKSLLAKQFFAMVK